MSYLRQFGPARTYVTLEPYTRQGYVAHCVDCKPEGHPLPSLTLRSSLDLEPCIAAAEEHAATVHPGRRTFEVGDRVTMNVGGGSGPYGTVRKVAGSTVAVSWDDGARGSHSTEDLR